MALHPCLLGDTDEETADVEASIEIVDTNNKHKKWNLTVAMEKEGHGFFVWVKKELIDSIALDKNGGRFKLIVTKHEVGNFSLDQSAAAIRAVVNCLQNYSPPTKEAKPDPKEKSYEYGTGFFVDIKGHILTNNHVIESCIDSDHIELSNQGIGNAIGKVLARDYVYDLALISTGIGGTQFAELRVGPVSLGESVWVYGFPLQGILSKPNFTNGMVAATSGMNDNVSQLQITAPVQPGNSGSPLMDKFGNVIGVVVSKLDAGRFNEQYGDIPQNVNFAIKASMAVALMSNNGLEPTTVVKTTQIDPVEIARNAQEFTIKISCESKGARHEKVSAS